MADDRKIRIILEGLDKLSGTMARARQGVETEVDKIKTSFKGADDAQRNLEKSINRATASWDKQSRPIQKIRKDLQGLAKDIEKVNNEGSKRSPVAQVLSGLKAGIGQAQQLQKDFEAAVSQKPGDLAKRRRDLDNEQRVRQAALTVRIDQEKRAFREEQILAKQALDERIKTLAKAAAGDREGALKASSDKIVALEEQKQNLAARIRTETEEKIAQLRAGIVEDISKDEIAAIRKEEALRKKVGADALAREKRETAQRIRELREESAESQSNRTLQRDKNLAAIRAQVTKKSTAEERQAAQELIAEERAAHRHDIAEEKSALQDRIAAQEASSEKVRARISQFTERDLDQLQKKIQFRSSPEEIAAVNEQIAKERAASEERITQETIAVQDRIEKEKEANRQINAESSASLQERIQTEEKSHRDRFREDAHELLQSQKNRQVELTSGFAGRRAEIGAPDRKEELNRLLQVRRAGENIGTTFERAGRKIGTVLGDLRTGFSFASHGGKDAERSINGIESASARVGAVAGTMVANFQKMVNIKWFIILSALQTLGTLVVVLGTNLVALASSAVFAASALGTAFAALVSQAVPAIGLFAAAAQRIKAVFAAVDAASKARVANQQNATTQAKQEREAVQRTADAQYALKQAYQGTADAQNGVVQASISYTNALQDHVSAIRSLGEARLAAQRGIVDANFSERDSALSLKEAELGVIDAKLRLRDLERQHQQDSTSKRDAELAVKEAETRLDRARKEGDRAEIANATNQLGVAKADLQNVSDTLAAQQNQVADAKAAVTRSQLTLDESRVQNKRAQQDAETTRKRGVEGNTQVISARRQLVASEQAIKQAELQQAAAHRAVADSIHQVTIAQRNLHDAREDQKTAGSSSQDKQAKALLAALDPAEKKLFSATERIKALYKKQFRPITDIIVNAFANALDRVSVLLTDPKIHKALLDLAHAFGNAITNISKFVVKPEFRKELTQFIENAAKNLPKVVSIFEHLLGIFGHLATAGAPIFASLLGGLDSLTGRADKATAPRDTVRGRVGTAGARNTSGANEPTGFSKFLDRAKTDLTAWLKLIGAITRFFRYLFDAGEPAGQSLVKSLTDFFNHLADWLRDNPDKAHKFFQDMLDDLKEIGHILEKLVPALVKAFTSKTALALSEFLLTVVIPALVTTLQVVGLITGAFIKLTHIPVIGGAIEFLGKMIISILFLTKLFPFLKNLSGVIDAVTLAVKGLRIAFVALFLESPIGWIALLAAGIVYLLYRLHLLRPLINAIIELFTHPIRFLKDHWKDLLIATIMGPFALLINAILRTHPKLKKAIVDGFVNAFKAVGEWFSHIGEWLQKHIIDPILKFFRIESPSKLMYDIGKNVVKGFVNAFLELPAMLVAVFKTIPGLIKDAIKGLPELVKKLVEKIPGVKAVLGLAGGIKKGVESVAHKVIPGYATGGHVRPDDRGGARGPYGTDTVPAMLTPGEWILNKLQQSKLAKHFGVTVANLSNFLFGSNSGSKPTGPGGSKLITENNDPYVTAAFTVRNEADQDGNSVWFIEFGDGTYGQISQRAADRIKNSQGKWFPDYARRAAQKHKGFFHDPRLKALQQIANVPGIRTDAHDRRFAMGGIVPAGFARGGPVVSSPGARGKQGNHISQHFQVKTEGETDWNYVMRLGALHAQEAY